MSDAAFTARPLSIRLAFYRTAVLYAHVFNGSRDFFNGSVFFVQVLAIKRQKQKTLPEFIHAGEKTAVLIG